MAFGNPVKLLIGQSIFTLQPILLFPGKMLQMSIGSVTSTYEFESSRPFSLMLVRIPKTISPQMGIPAPEAPKILMNMGYAIGEYIYGRNMDLLRSNL